MILGFLAEGPLHGYELRRKMEQLHGYARTISDGTMYPAIKRLAKAGALTEHPEAGRGAVQRNMLHLTEVGRERLEHLLRRMDGHDITDGSRFFLVLAFLSLLPDEQERRAVLQRRLDYLDQASSFFFDGDRPLRSTDLIDRYRRGIFISARAARNAERAWLRDELSDSYRETEKP